MHSRPLSRGGLYLEEPPVGDDMRPATFESWARKPHGAARAFSFTSIPRLHWLARIPGRRHKNQYNRVGRKAPRKESETKNFDSKRTHACHAAAPADMILLHFF
jgi:hypothetical protein